MTNKEQLTEIRQEQSRMAKEQLKIADELSEFISKQDKFNQRIEMILLNDSETGNHGLVTKVHKLNTKVSELETDKKVAYGRATLLVGLGAIMWKVVTFIISNIK